MYILYGRTVPGYRRISRRARADRIVFEYAYTEHQLRGRGVSTLMSDVTRLMRHSGLLHQSELESGHEQSTQSR